MWLTRICRQSSSPSGIRRLVPGPYMKACTKLQDGVSVEWVSGEKAFFHYTWLYDNAPQNRTENLQRLHESWQLPSSSVLGSGARLTFSEDYIQLHWGERGLSTFPASWLYQHVIPNSPPRSAAATQSLDEMLTRNEKSLTDVLDSVRAPWRSGDLRVRNEAFAAAMQQLAEGGYANIHDEADQEGDGKKPPPAIVPSVSEHSGGICVYDWDQIGGGTQRYDSQLWVLLSLWRDGVVMIRGLTHDTNTVLRAAEWFGYVRETKYGRAFDVCTVGDTAANNLAYTDRALSCHTDNPYREPIPGVQLLHCIQPAHNDEAVTLLSDGFAVANDIRERWPEDFNTLTQPWPFHYVDVTDPMEKRLKALQESIKQERPDQFGGQDEVKKEEPLLVQSPPDAHTRFNEVDMYAERPPIDVDRRGRVRRIVYNNRSASPAKAADGSTDEQQHVAWQRMGAMLNNDRYMVKVRLQQGDLLIFDNHRIAHGRTAYTDTNRLLQGCYIDHDHVMGRLRALLSKRRTALIYNAYSQALLKQELAAKERREEAIKY
mmetsp:Transcript_34161/g.98372  ORF Transcript_34161/g.98372 Transcript_34161/m.98372 type:complete len:544 (-) Transcript_34161:67-1698(-)